MHIMSADNSEMYFLNGSISVANIVYSAQFFSLQELVYSFWGNASTCSLHLLQE